MSRRRDTARIVVCRGCCCGTPRRHPDVDHDAHLATLRRTRDRTGRTVPVLISGCLGPCAQGNTIVVQPSASGRRRGAKSVWLGFINDSQAISELTGWLAAGGPGIVPIPAALELHRIAPLGRSALRGR